MTETYPDSTGSLTRERRPRGATLDLQALVTSPVQVVKVMAVSVMVVQVTSRGDVLFTRFTLVQSVKCGSICKA